MKVSLITPVDIKYSYKGTEYHVYEYARYLQAKRIDTEILVTKTNADMPRRKNNPASNRYRSIPKRPIDCSETLLPFNYHLFTYWGLPSDRIIYLPFGIYQYFVNVAFKPLGQKYIIGCHGMHLKFGSMIEGHHALDAILRSATKSMISAKGREADNLYFHVINSEQKMYLEKLGIKSRNIFYVPAMLDTKNYHIGYNSSKRLKVIHIGGLGKGSDIVLQIIKRIIGEGKIDMFEFYFIWDEQPPELYKYAKNNPNIHVLGTVPEREKARVLSIMDVIVIPAYENFPKAMLEGLASGLYVVTSRKNSAATDIKKYEVNIYITNRGTPDEYVAPLIKLAKLKSSRRKIFDMKKEINRKATHEHFDKEKVLPQILKMFENVSKG